MFSVNNESEIQKLEIDGTFDELAKAKQLLAVDHALSIKAVEIIRQKAHLKTFKT